MQKIQEGVLQTSISVDSIIMFTGISIDGIMQSVAMNTTENAEDKTLIEVPEMFQTLAKALISFLEESHIDKKDGK